MHIRKAIHKLRFYIPSFASYIIPRKIHAIWRKHLFAKLNSEERREIRLRVDYYIRCLATDGRQFNVRTGNYKFPFGEKHKHSAYFFDLYNTVKYFPADLRMNYIFGDVTHEPPTPTIVKSRPITEGATNSVIMKLNSVRHFRLFKDTTPFRQKRDMLVFRNVVRQPQRILFMERFFGHPMCDCGKTNADMGHEEWLSPFMSVAEQLNYKFVACIEGNDVATNLKWVMASNSVAVMPRPRYETWFMEGKLKPGVHYIEVADDYHDLPEKLQHYISHPDEAEQIIRNAHEYMAQFLDKRRERLIQIAVLNEYFHRSGQTDNTLI